MRTNGLQCDLRHRASGAKASHNHDFMSHRAASNCNLDANPLHEEQLQIVKMIGGAWALNTVIDEQLVETAG
ncbi:MAG: hypothetical protein AAGD07_23400 [Planctomycetota bacterium]